MPGPDGGTLWSLRYYDSFYKTNATRDRPENNNADRFVSEEGEPFAICPFSVIKPFTTGTDLPHRATYEDAFSIALAIHHLNTGDGSIVPQVADLNETCPLRFTMRTADTEYTPGIALKHVVDETKKACAFIGAYRSAVSMPMAIVTGLLGYPQISSKSTSADLDDRSQYPLFGRTVPSDAGNAVPLVLFLRNALQIQHLAVINVNDAYGNAYVEGMRQAAAKYVPDLIIQQIPVDATTESIKAAVRSVKQIGFRFVFSVVFTKETHDELLLEAYNQGVAGNGLHNWIFGDSFLGVLVDRTFEKDSPLYKAYRGVGLLEISGGVTGMEKYDAYVEQLSQMRNAIDMDYMRGLWPRPDLPPPEFVQPDDPTFLNQVVTSGFSPFAYEAAIALGLSACAAVINSENVTLFLNGTLHYEEYRANEFDGISGRVALDPLTGTRLPETALYRVVNYNPVPVDPSSPDGNQKFDTLLTHVFIDSEWEARGEYIFNDGTANLPADLAPPPDGNTGMLIGVACGVTAFLLLATSLVWCLIREHKRKSNDSVWRVQKHELHFADPPEILGRGQYGLVLSAEYRGTKVAVKRAIPPKKKMKKSETSPGKIGSNVRRSLFDPESEALAGIDPSTTQGDATEDHSGTSSGPGRATVSGTHSNNGRQSGKTSWSNMGVLSDLTKSHKNSVSSEHQNYRKMREDFVEEMRYLSRLRHPCITTVMGAVMEKDEEPMLVMEFMDHGSLYDLLHNETMVLEGDVLLQILCDISQGIRFLHSAEPKVIHGDLKTANILVDTRFRAKVADFGLSQEKNMGGTGTPFWMAPELLRRESKNTDKTDVYSFGIMLYEVYARRDPYEGQPARDVLRAVADPLIRKRPPAPSHMPAALKALMADCLDDDPEKRPTFEEIDTRLRRIDAEAALSASAASNAKNSHVSLFDIFPRHVAEALRDGRKVEPEHKDVVTIFFSDIVGYTDMSARMDPSKVANMLDRLYHKFDTLSQELEIFKVETIGDAYMAVTNLVSKQTYDHAKRIAHFAIRAVAVANETLIDEDDPTKGHVNIRVGFHSGPVVADVVGNRNPRYCLFGDTVNTASRMESNSAMNRINCSEEAAKYLKEQAPEIPLKPRGMVSIKGKGEMNCFWVNEQGTAKDSALERIRAKQKLKLLQQEIDQWGGGVIAPEQAPQKDLESQQLSAVAEGASRHFNEAPSAEFKKMEISLKDRLGRGQKCETWDMQFL